MGGGSSANSSGEEDGDAEWKAAIDSVAAVNLGTSTSNRPATPQSVAGGSTAPDDPRDEQLKKPQTPGLKLYQIKAQKLLDDLLEKSLEMVTNPIPMSNDNPQSNGGGIQLFRKAPPGIILDPIDPHPQPRKRPKILPGKEVDEKSKKFRRQLQSVIVDGNNIMAAAREACQRSLARFEAKEAAAKAAAKKEEERVLELKKVRGEKWLPSIAREMQGKT
ncbi:uncharacterized protein [Elaeis guineensis]|uniref:Uncharacterized protein LOC105057944 n=1 Tax=Elaeis guineensis var. tenera TaxID=51953 RepID=A0A6I9S7V2_ELAGV|nr:uncharacterized protein LOC105057944 [Elaeis guineensis]